MSIGHIAETHLSLQWVTREVFLKGEKKCLSSGFKMLAWKTGKSVLEAEGSLCGKVWRWRRTQWVRGTTRGWTDGKGRSVRGSLRCGREPGCAEYYKSSSWGLKWLKGPRVSEVSPVSVTVMKWTSRLWWSDYSVTASYWFFYIIY